MAIQPTAQWWIRTDGDDDNGGGFDSGISGAGTNYSDQATAQLDLTDLATASAGSTTLTSATGGFTAAMIGNCVKLRSGTNVATGYYFITGFTDANTVTIDRSCDNGAGGLSAGAGKLGGAWGNIETTVTTNAVALGNSCASPLVGKNQVNIRGNGLVDPSTPDYTFSNYRIPTQGSAANGRIRFVGYNGTPSLLAASMLVFYQPYYNVFVNIKFVGNASPSYQDWNLVYSNGTTECIKCIFDLNGYNGRCASVGSAIDCYFKNSGSSSSYAFGVTLTGYNATVSGNVFDLGANSTAIYNQGSRMSSVTRNLIIGGSYGFDSTYTYLNHRDSISQNTFVGCGTAIKFSQYSSSFFRNLFVNCTTAFDPLAGRENNVKELFYHNAFYNNGTKYNNLEGGLDDIDLTSDPFVDSANGNYALAAGSAARGIDLYANIPGYNGTANYTDIGAIQHADPAYVAPPDASATTKVFPFRSWVEGDFQQEGADADEFVEKHELQALPVFEFSIGTGADRDYNSLTAFFAAFDNTLVNVPNSKVIVTCYNDTGADQWISDTSTVTASCPTNCIDFLLTVDDDSWHKGQYGKGVMIKLNSSSQYALYINPVYNGGIFSVERLSVDANNQFNQNGNFRSVVYVGPLASTGFQPIPPSRLKDLYVRGGDGTPFNCKSAYGIGVSSRNVYIESCIVENIVGNGGATNYSTVGILASSRSLVRNCTVNNIDSNTTTLNYGIYGGTDATYGLTENCVVTNVNGDCYLSTLTNTSNLVADDATGTIQSTAAGEFVDAANSDYKLKGTASSAGIVAATDAKVTDITGKLRKAGVAQDAGAFNNVAGYDDSPVFPPDQPTDPIIHPLRSN